MKQKARAGVRRQPKLVRCARAALLFALLAVAAPAEAANAVKKLQSLEDSVESARTHALDLEQKSAAIRQELDSLRPASIEAARVEQEAETQLTALESRLQSLRQSEESDLAALRARHAELALRLAAIERIALFPPEALLTLPETPLDMARSAMLLRAAMPAIQARAGALKRELDRLASLRAAILGQKDDIAAAKGKLEERQKTLDAVTNREQQLYQLTEWERADAESHVASLSSQAKDLQELMDRIEAAARARNEALAPSAPPASNSGAPSASPDDTGDGTPAPSAQPSSTEPSGPATGEAQTTAPLPPQIAAVPPAAGALRLFSAAHGQLATPARGPVVKSFGAREAYGVTAKGITIKTRAGAEVVAPYDGKVVFAGEFRGYGRILIIEHSEGYHSLLSGLSRIDAVAGQKVLAGEPVGVMGQPDDGNGPELYVELRRNGRPIDPSPWLASQTGKVSG
jgi:septal ring factor EnvC (AmiA/AmiB activator)